MINALANTRPAGGHRGPTGRIFEGRAPVSGRSAPQANPRSDQADLRWRISGNASGPLLIVLGGISADRQIDRWWPGVAGPSGALSAERFQRLSIDWPDPCAGRAHDTGAALAVDDIADALAGLLDALGIDCADAVVGASFGAMVGLSLAARHPQRLERLVAVSGAHRSTPAATAGRLIQRKIIETLADLGDPVEGVALARGLALTSYRPAGLFDQRFFDSDPERTLESIGRYLEHNGSRFAAGFDAGRYLALSSALDRHRVDPKSIRCRTDLIGVTSDTLVPVAQLRELAGAIGMRARLHLIDSPFGHDAFLKSPELLNPLLENLLADLPGVQAHV